MTEKELRRQQRELGIAPLDSEEMDQITDEWETRKRWDRWSDAFIWICVSGGAIMVLVAAYQLFFTSAA